LENCPGENRGQNFAVARATFGNQRSAYQGKNTIFSYSHDVYQYGQARSDQHDLGIHLVVAANESSDGQPDEDARDDPDHEDGGHGSNNLGPIPAEGHPVKDRKKRECA